MSVYCRQCGASIDFVQASTESHPHCPECGALQERALEQLSTKVVPGDVTEQLATTYLAKPSPQLHLGRFELLERIGQGGFGTVYRAHDDHLNRIVALKMPHGSELATPEHKAAFFREAQKAAALDHPGIVPVFDAGEIDGVPFIASRLIRGRTLAEAIRETRLPYRQSAEIVASVADALQHAHDRMLVHRDVKPGNIMLSIDGRPLLMDFGIAIDVERDNRMTSDGRVKGTPAYMSPEQAAGESHLINFRTDIYSLGVVLYEMLTGERPFHGVHQKVIDQIRFDEPRSLRSFNTRIPADLQTICQKAMEKEPSRRYASAAEFAAELRRWLNDEPILTRPTGPSGRFVRWCRRNKTLAASLAVIFLTLATSSAVFIHLYLKERETLIAKGEAVQQANQRTSRHFVANAEQFIREDVMAALPWLAEACRIDRADETRGPISRLRLQCALLECPQLERVWFHDAPIHRLAVSDDRRRLASASTDGQIRVWDATSGSLVKEILWKPASQPDLVAELHFVNGGRHLIVSGDNDVQIWDVEAGNMVAAKSYGQPINDIEVDPSETVIATAHSDNRVRLWSWSRGDEPTRELMHGAPVFSLAFNPLGGQLASGGSEGVIRTWKIDTGEEIKSSLRHDQHLSAVQYSHNGTLLAAASSDGLVQIWECRSWQPLYSTAPKLSFPVTHLQFSPDDSQIGTSTNYVRGEATTIWKVSDGSQSIPWLGHGRPVQGIAFSPDSRLFLTVGEDGTVRVWDTQTGKLAVAPLRHVGPLRNAHFLDHERIIAAGDDQTIRQWNFRDRNSVVSLGPDRLVVAALSPAGRQILVGSKNRMARAHNLDGAPAKTLRPMTHGGSVQSLAYNKDGSLIATGAANGTAGIWDANDGRAIGAPLLHASTVKRVRFLGTGTQIATICRDSMLRIWNSRTGAKLWELEHPAELNDCALSLDGQILAACCDQKGDQSVLLWKVDPESPPQRLAALSHPTIVKRVVFHPTENLLLSVGTDRILRVWDCASGAVVTEFSSHTGRVTDALFSPDGKHVASLSEDGTARLWNTRSGKAVTTVSLNSTATDAAFSPDGRFLVCGCSNGSVRIWDAGTGEPISPPFTIPGPVIECCFSPDGRLVIAIGEKGGLRTYTLPETELGSADPELAALLLSGQRMLETGEATALSPQEYRELAGRPGIRTEIPQLAKP